MTQQNTLVRFGGQPCVIMDPAKYRQAQGKANGYCCPLGKSPGIGYVLMLRQHWDRVERRRNSPQYFQVEAGDSVSCRGMYIISAVKISGGRPNDPNSVYMVKFADARWLAAKFSDCTLQINVRCPAPPDDGTPASLYYEDSLDSGSVHTWSRAVERVWGSLPMLGAFPSLPGATPDGIPEGFQFLGVNAWDALHVLLDKLQCAVKFAPLTGLFSIVKLGTTQAGLSDAIRDANNGRGYLDDAEPFDVAATDAPETIRVYFSRIDKHYGSERETQRASGTWATSLLYAVDAASGISGAVAGTVLQLWDDLPAIAAFDGSIDNVAAVEARAADRVATWQADYNNSRSRLRTVYQGVVDSILPGSQIKYVWWRDTGEGWMTEVARHDGFWELPGGLGSTASEGPAENLSPPDLGRRTFPNFPQYLQLVTVDSASGGDPAGTVVSPTSDGLFPGVVTRMNPDAATDSTACFTNSESCWLLVVNRLTGSASTGPTLVKGEKYLGRLCGSKLLGADARPVYLIHKDETSQLVFFELTADLVYGTPPAADNAKILEWTGAAYAATGAAIRIFDWLAASPYAAWVGRAPAGGFAGYQGLATIGPSGRYEIVWMEEQAKWIKFTINSQLKYNASSVAATLVHEWDGREVPGGTLTVYNSETDTAGIYRFWGPADATGYAVYDDSDGKYKIVDLEGHSRYIEFTLASASAGTAAFTAGTAAGATVNSWWDGRKWWGGTTRDIQDPQGLFVRALQGGKGIARWNEQYDSGNGGYEVIECQSKAGYVDFTLTGSLSGGSSSGATVNDYGGSQQDVQNPGSTVTVYDDQALYASKTTGDKGRAIYDAVEDKYRIVSMKGGAIGAYGALAQDGAASSVAAGATYTTIPFDYASASSVGCTCTTGASANITVTGDGVYHITFSGSQRLTAAPAGTRANGSFSLFINGSALSGPSYDTLQDNIETYYNSGSIHAILSLSAGDVITVRARNANDAYQVTNCYLTVIKMD